MNSVIASLSALIAICGGAFFGAWLARRLPEQHLTGETGTAVSVAMAVVGTLAALVLGLMVNSANASFSARGAALESLANSVIKLNRTLIAFGPATADIRRDLDAYARAKAREQAQGGDTVGIDTLHRLEAIGDAVLRLTPQTPREQHLQERAWRMIEGISDARWLLAEKTHVALPTPFLFLLVGWLTLLFASFGLFAPKNATVFAFLLLGATAISGCIFIILELGSPTHGLIRPSVEPLLDVIEELKLTLDQTAARGHAALPGVQ